MATVEQGNFPFTVVRNRSIVLNESLEEISILMQDLKDTAEDALQVANYTFNFLDLVSCISRVCQVYTDNY